MLSDIFMGTIPTLEEENAAVAALKADPNNSNALRVLAPTLRSVVFKLAAKYAPIIPREETSQLCLIAITVAAQRFDPSRGNRFFTYAQWWFRANLSEEVRRLRRPAKYGVHMVSTLPSFSSDEGEPLDLLDTVCDPSADQALAFSDAQEAERVRSLAYRWLEESQFSSDRAKSAHRMLLDEVVFQEEPTTLRDLAARLGVTYQRVGQLMDRMTPRLHTYIKQHWETVECHTR